MKLAPDMPQSIIQQELAIRKKLIKATALFTMLAIAIMLPATIAIPNHYAWIFAVGIEVMLAGALLLNAFEKTLLASGVIVISTELAIFGVLLTTRPFEILNLRLYDLFIIGEILTITLLPPKSVWAVLGINITFVLFHVYFGSHSQALTAILHTQTYNAWAVPTAIQVVVTGASYFWVQHINQILHRYYRDFQQLRFEVKMLLQRQQQFEQVETPTEGEPLKKQG